MHHALLKICGKWDKLVRGGESRMDEAEQRRRFRARPLRVDDGVKVLYFNKRLKKEEKDLYQWLLSSDGQAQVLD